MTYFLFWLMLIAFAVSAVVDVAAELWHALSELWKALP